MSEFDIVLQHGDSLSRTFTFTNVTFVSTDTILFILSPINDDYPLYIEKYTGVTGNSFNLEIDKEETLRIGADEYSYRIVLESENSRTTILGPARFSVKKGIVKKNNSSASVTLDIITQAEALLEQMSGIAAVGVEEAQALVNSAAASASQVLASASTILTNSANAKTSEDNAKVSETNSKTSETNAKSSEDNAKTYMQQAKNYSENVNVFIPSVTNGILSWTNEANLTNPTPVNIKGDKGDKGDQGIQGIQGVKGDKGDTGERGPQGEKGADGTMTFADLTAEQKASLKGDKGDQGIQGIQGIQGVKGDTGAKGDKGDAFTYEDFTSEQLASLKGAKGDKGDKGEDGTTPDMSLYATKTELENVTFTLPTASATTLGGVKIGSNLSIDENGVLSASGVTDAHINSLIDAKLGAIENGSY